MTVHRRGHRRAHRHRLRLATSSSTSGRARAEVGSEIELAPNRKPYYSDEELEGRSLDRTLTYGLLGLLVVVAVGLPLYWLAEPGRQDGAIKDFDEHVRQPGRGDLRPDRRGRVQLRRLPRRQEGVGGVAPYTITDANGEFVAR